MLFDAGISARQAELRLAQHGRDIRDVDALIISHDHRDHTTGMGVFHRKFGLPVYVTQKTFVEVRRRVKIGDICDVRHFVAGETLSFGPVSVETYSTPHDAADGVVFVIQDSRHRFGLLTDLGHIFDGLAETMATLDAVLVESNYDPAMLDDGPYPDFLKHRIRGPRGHLSNIDAAELLKLASPDRLRWACLAHLSEQNNCPDVAIQTHHKILGCDFPVRCADRKATSAAMTIE
ncbi:Putative metallo-hydrolase YycJ [Rubripirellula lacrimiformis]|uniref:Metallo-hydrolase YycJ n=2 Tax=Rubripirellula lacrimiformis TaxID=1930273 RepID=A0A517NKN4_9BACT|nr:Putative metallo-hydrolase YycJ [Rubripirellula lacrimiformis]